MKTYRRITPRQAIVEEASRALAKEFPGSTVKNYEQNAWRFIGDALTKPARQAYYTSLSPRAYRMLVRTVARAAYPIGNQLRMVAK